jgi:hypothetical protein
MGAQLAPDLAGVVADQAVRVSAVPADQLKQGLLTRRASTLTAYCGNAVRSAAAWT